MKEFLASFLCLSSLKQIPSPTAVVALLIVVILLATSKAAVRLSSG